MVDLAAAMIALPLTLAAAYLGALGLFALLPSRKFERAADSRRSFAVVIPAHNEEATLPRLLASLREATNRRGDVRLHVIADNCSDETARVAREGGAMVWERHDDARRSKGHALAWLMEQPSFWSSDFDAVVFIDADCVVNVGFFTALERELARGAQALQTRYDVLEPGRSATLELRQFAFGLVHVVRPLGKRAFGGSAGLKGTGMCFTRETLTEVPWRATGLAEDVEQHARLVRSGRAVRFILDAIVAGAMPANLAVAAQQHERWEAGRLSVARHVVPGLLAEAVRRRSIVMLDAAVEQLVPPTTVLCMSVVCLTILTTLFDLQLARMLSLAALTMLACYSLAGIIVLRPPVRAFGRALAVAPLYAAWKLVRYVRSLMPGRPAAWTRTSRDHAA